MKKVTIRFSVAFILFIAITFVFVGNAKAEPYGWSPNVDNSNQGPPKCTDAKPDKAPILLQPNHPVLPKKPKKGEVVLYWHKVPGATGYNIYYGLAPKNYIFSAPNIGDTNNFTVGFLPNKIFYFAVQAQNGCAAGNLSKEWAARPGGGGYSGYSPVLGTTAKVIPVRKPTASPQVRGAETGPRFGGSDQQPNTGGTTYQPQETQPQAPPPPVAQPLKKKSLWESILSIFFGK